jgi:two-component system chemotaxis response regulator CheB
MNNADDRTGFATRDIVTIGASAGGVKPLRDILKALPADFPASVFVVLHIGAESHLTEILDRACALPVVSPDSGDTITRSRVYVAPPARHLLLHDGHVLLRRGPRENLSRPAIDPLFRSAACSYGSRVIGVILSGALNDGTAGLRAIKRCGGTAVVQLPSDAMVPHMPMSALNYVEVDHVVPASGIAGLLTRLVREPAGPTPPVPYEIRLETAIATQELDSMGATAKLGQLSSFTCPECQGTLWEVNDGEFLRYRCHVGHAYTAETILVQQAGHAEEMLFKLLRTHQERAVLARRMADQERTQGRLSLADSLERRATGYDEDAEVIRRLLHVTTGAGEKTE